MNFKMFMTILEYNNYDVNLQIILCTRLKNNFKSCFDHVQSEWDPSDWIREGRCVRVI